MDRFVPWWSYVGTVSGAGLGFIGSCAIHSNKAINLLIIMTVANIPGAMVGALAGNRIGKIRDAKGKSVAAVFADLGGDQKAEVSINVHHRDGIPTNEYMRRFCAHWQPRSLALLLVLSDLLML